VNVRFARQCFAGGLGVATRHRVADEQNARQLRVVLHEVPGGGLPRDFPAFVQRQVKTSELILEHPFPRLLIGWQLGDKRLITLLNEGVCFSLLGGGFGSIGGLALRRFGGVKRREQQGGEEQAKTGDCFDHLFVSDFLVGRVWVHGA